MYNGPKIEILESRMRRGEGRLPHTDKTGGMGNSFNNSKPHDTKESFVKTTRRWIAKTEKQL